MNRRHDVLASQDFRAVGIFREPRQFAVRVEQDSVRTRGLQRVDELQHVAGKLATLDGQAALGVEVGRTPIGGAADLPTG